MAIIADVLDVGISKFHIPVWPVWIAGAIFEVLCRPFGINPPLYRRRVDFFIKDRAFDISKAKTILGYKPKIHLSTGLSLTAEWYSKKNYI